MYNAWRLFMKNILESRIYSGSEPIEDCCRVRTQGISAGNTIMTSTVTVNNAYTVQLSAYKCGATIPAGCLGHTSMSCPILTHVPTCRSISTRSQRQCTQHRSLRHRGASALTITPPNFDTTRNSPSAARECAQGLPAHMPIARTAPARACPGARPDAGTVTHMANTYTRARACAHARPCVHAPTQPPPSSSRPPSSPPPQLHARAHTRARTHTHTPQPVSRHSSPHAAVRYGRAPRGPQAVGDGVQLTEQLQTKNSGHPLPSPFPPPSPPS